MLKLASENDLESADLQRAQYIRIFQGAVALAALGLVAVYAYLQLFSTFAPWDDEGYFLQAFREVLSGRVLYDQVFAFYGPLTFFMGALAARFDAANVTPDALRWVEFPVWIAISALMAGVVWKLTRRFSPSVVAFLLVGLRLGGLAKGVGHPQLWIILATALLLWLGLDNILQPGKKRHAFWNGALIGAILLLKINIGIFIAVGYLLAVGLPLKPLARRFVCGLAATGALAIAAALLLASTTLSERFFVLAFLTSISGSLSRRDEGQTTPASLIWLAAGLAVSVSAGVLGTLADGTTLRGLYAAFVTTPAQFARSYHSPFLEPTQMPSVLICLVGLCAAVFAWLAMAQVRSMWIGLLKVAAGIGLSCAFYFDHRLTLTGSLLFLWLLIVDVPRMPLRAYSNRLLLALLSAFFSLQLFPMSGEQVDWATLMPITSAAVLLADGMNCLARESRGASKLRLTMRATGAAVIALTIFMFVSVARNTRWVWQSWHASQPVGLQGASWLRLPVRQKDRLITTVNELSQNCKTVLMVPSLYSLSMWSGVPPAEEKRINGWPFIWPDDVEKNELRRLQQQSGGCALVSWDVYRFFRRSAVSPGNGELLDQIERTMNPVYSAPDITLYRSRN